MNQHFGELRSLLQSSLPAQVIWSSTCALLAEFSPEELDHIVLPYASAHLAKLPARVRTVPLEWLERLLRSQPLPALSLAAHLDTAGRRMRLENIGAEVIARTPHLTGLRLLTLRAQLLREEGLGMLLEAPFMEHLTEVTLDENPLGDRGAALLANSAPWPSLRALSLRGTGMAKPGLARLLDSSLMLTLRELDVSSNDFGWGTGSVLSARAGKLHHLSTLKLQRCGIPPVDAATLGFAISANHAIQSIDLSENGFGDVAVAATLSLLTRPLHALTLSKNGVSTQAIAQLAAREHPLTALTLSERELCALAPLSQVPGLRALHLSQGLGEGAGSGMFEQGFEALESLALRSSPLDVQLVQELVESDTWGRLHALDMSAAALTPRHIRALCSSTAPALTSLVLDFNGLGEEAAMMLARAAHAFPRLADLSLRYNHIEAPGQDALRAAYPGASVLF